MTPFTARVAAELSGGGLRICFTGLPQFSFFSSHVGFFLNFAGTFSVCASRFIVTDGQIEDTSEVQLQKSYLVSSGQRSRSPVCSNYPSVGCNWGGMDEVNWLEWIVLRCEPKTDTDGNMVEVVVVVVGGLIGEEETFPEKAIKLIDDFPGGMFPQVCAVRTCVRTRNAILGRGTSTIRKN